MSKAEKEKAVGSKVVEPNVAFWASEIEYQPGETLILRPLLPAVDMAKIKDSYELRVELPAALRKTDIDLLAVRGFAETDRPYGWQSFTTTPELTPVIKGSVQIFSYRLTPPFKKLGETRFMDLPALDVPADFSGKHMVRWSVLTDGKKVVLQGESLLVPAPQTQTPRRIEFTIWLCETVFETLPHNVQEIWLSRLKRLGLNGIMPTIREPMFDKPLDEIDFANWTAQWGRRNGMAVRSYLDLCYNDHSNFSMPNSKPVNKPYLDKHPEYRGENLRGEKVPYPDRGGSGVCPTHGLDGDKYDDKQTGVRGGKDNPWLGRLYEIVKRSVKANDLQGVWWDYELGVERRNQRQGQKT